MRVCHGFTAVFDDPNLVSCAGLAPVLGLAERSGLQRPSRLLIDLAGRAPLLPGADQLAYIDIDDTVRRTYGYAKHASDARGAVDPGLAEHGRTAKNGRFGATACRD